MIIPRVIKRVIYLLKKDILIVCPYLILTLLFFQFVPFNRIILKGFNQNSSDLLLVSIFIIVFQLLEIFVRIITLRMAFLVNQGENLTFSNCVNESFKKVLAFIFVTIFLLFCFFIINSVVSLFYKGEVPLSLLISLFLITYLILFLWEPAIIVENTGPFKALAKNFKKAFEKPIDFLLLIFLFLFTYILSGFILLILKQISLIGEFLNIVFSGFSMALVTVLRLVGYLELGKL